MNGKLRRMIAAAIVLVMMVGTLQIIMPRVEAQPPGPSMYLVPSTETFSTNTASVGTLFNVTGWINVTESSTGWSAGLLFNASQLQVVTATFSGTGGTESLWLQDSSIPTTSVLAESAYWNNTLGTVGEPSGFGETAYYPYVATSNVGSLFVIEFNITQAPPPGGSLTSNIQWDPTLSYGFDSNGLEEYGFSFGNCTYTFSSSTVVTPQHITFAQSGLDSSASGTVVTVNGTAETFSQLPYTVSANTGDTLIFSYQTTVSSSISGKQFINTGVNVTSPLTVSATETVTGSYETQYQVSFAVSPSGDGTTSPSGTNVWEDAGSLSISATPNSGFVFSSWTTTGSITVSNPSSASTTANVAGSGTITASFVSGVTYSVTFNESGLTPGTTWSVTFNSLTESSTSNTITFTGVSNGGYSYTVGSVSGFAASPASGSITVSSANVSQTITFTVQHHNVVVTNITGPEWVYYGFSANISVTVSDIGEFSENAWVTLYYNMAADKSIDSFPVALNVGENFTFTYLWNTEGVTCHNYTLTAVATIATGSNTFTGGNITVRLVGDVNGDGFVNLKDIVIVAKLMGTTPSSPNWNPAADINGDGKVDMKDLALVVRNFGEQTTY